jgi:hypothetical protein
MYLMNLTSCQLIAESLIDGLIDWCQAEKDPTFYIRFINMLINDAIFLLDESLNKLPEIKELEAQVTLLKHHQPHILSFSVLTILNITQTHML